VLLLRFFQMFFLRCEPFVRLLLAVMTMLGGKHGTSFIKGNVVPRACIAFACEHGPQVQPRTTEMLREVKDEY
jgi:hypothetical protein